MPSNVAMTWWNSIFLFGCLVMPCSSIPAQENKLKTNCMADLVKLSGVSNESGVLHVLQREGVDEQMLSRLEYATADTLLKNYGLELAVQRSAILWCVNIVLKNLKTSKCFGYAGPCGHGMCRLLRNGEAYEYRCECNKGYAPPTCKRELNECELQQPCRNGARCEDRVNNYTCHCAPGYFGKHCETDRNECASAPCFHGNCIDVVNGFTCACDAGFTGQVCETDIDDCSPNPCYHGTCKDGVNSFTCSCQPGYTGSRCEKDINECSSSPCQNFGTCHDRVNGYVCQCFHGYKGKDCETEWLNETAFQQFADSVKNKGPVYIRWGRTSCPTTATLLYTGSVAGSHHGHKGSGSDPLCLPDQPIYGRHADYQWGGILYGAEYKYATNAPYSSSFKDKDAPCAVCMAIGKGGVFMLAARNVCPSGWVREYHGYLMSEHYSSSYRSQHLCFDDDIEAIKGRDSSTGGIYFYPVSVDCGYGLACPPYVDARELTCCVCSK